MSERTQITEELKQEMQRLRNEGLPASRISKILSVGERTVYTHTYNPKTGPKSNPKRKLKKEKRMEKIKAMQQMRERGMAMHTIAEKFGVTRNYVVNNTRPPQKQLNTKPKPKGCKLPEALRGRVKINGRMPSEPVDQIYVR